LLNAKKRIEDDALFLLESPFQNAIGLIFFFFELAASKLSSVAIDFALQST
jgi:hypothetical protein